MESVVKKEEEEEIVELFGCNQCPGATPTPPPPPRVDDDDDDDWGDEQYAIYNEAIARTDGFDVPVILPIIFCQIVPFDLEVKYQKDDCVEFSKAAIDAFNHKLKDTEGELEFVDLLMAMAVAVRGIMYYLTFNAKNLAMGGRIITYQAVVLNGVEEVEVLSFRVKPGQDGGTNKGWFWVGHLCGPQGCKTEA